MYPDRVRAMAWDGIFMMLALAHNPWGQRSSVDLLPRVKRSYDWPQVMHGWWLLHHAIALWPDVELRFFLRQISICHMSSW